MFNPTWRRILVTCLTKDLQQSNSLIMKLREQVRNRKEENEAFHHGAVEVFSVTNEIQRSIADDAVVTARGWKYLSGMAELVQGLLHFRLPEVAIQLNSVDPETWKSLFDEGICPEILYDQMTKTKN